MNFQNIPFTDVVKFGQINMLERPLFSTSWILGRFCNYKCSYCWPHARSDALDFFKLEDYQQTIDQIKQQARNNGFTEFHWGFSGGEPTAYKDLLNLIKYLDDGVQTPYQSVHMTTNLSPGKKWWTNWLSATELLQRRGLTASYHAEFANESEFIDKCLFLIDSGVLLTVNQVMVPEHFWEYYERAKRLADKGINVTIKPQSDPTASFVVKTYMHRTQLHADDVAAGAGLAHGQRAHVFAADQPRQVLGLLRGRAVAVDLVHAQVAVRAIAQADAGAGAADLFHRHHVRQVAHAGATVGLGHGDAQQAEFAHLAPQVHRELVAGVGLRRQRRNLALGEIAHRVAQRVNVVAEHEVQAG